MENFYKSKNEKVLEEAKRMALFPTKSHTMVIPGLFVPVVVCENVYILPGVPQLFKRMIESLKSHFDSKNKKSRTVLYSPLMEGLIYILFCFIILILIIFYSFVFFIFKNEIIKKKKSS